MLFWRPSSRATARAAALQDFVRRLPFAVQARGRGRAASRILARGHGDAHDKAALFTALCRAAGLPARVQFLRVRSAVLAGLLQDPPEAIEHPVAQVYVDGRWLSTDGYVVDPVLFARAKQMLLATDLDSGWGIVRDASGSWDGRSPCLHQFHWDDVLVAHGVFDDVQEFLGSGAARDRRAFGALRHVVRAWSVNRRLTRIRSGGMRLEG